MAKLMVRDVRLAFPKIWTPEPFPNGNDPTPYFSAAFLFPNTHPAYKDIEKAIIEVAKVKWPKDWASVLKGAKAIGKVCMRNGDDKDSLEGYAGNYYLSARSKVRPSIFDQKRADLVEADGKPYSGCYVNVSVEIFAYTKGNKGVGAQLRGIQFLRDGDAFAGGGTAADQDEFDDIEAPPEDGDEETDSLLA